MAQMLKTNTTLRVLELDENGIGKKNKDNHNRS